VIRAAGAAFAAMLALTAAAQADGVPRTHIPGIVYVTTNLHYQGGSIRGTGIVLEPGGEVLTNNHVIRGATTIRVTDLDNRRSYSATVVGYDVSADLAVLRLRGASSLPTANLGNSAGLRRGDAVTGYGNADGAGGAAKAATGKVIALSRSITAVADDGGRERLTGLIETNAPIRPGDSGGPLLDAEGRTVGIDTAGSLAFVFAPGTASRGYAVPIDKARAIATRIATGRRSETIHIGDTAFLGVAFQPSEEYTGLTPGLTVVKVIHGSPAAKAGLRPGDVVTSVNGSPTARTADFEASMLEIEPGEAVAINWTSITGAARTATVLAGSGPPQ
jgi:S1-C subfamily serine protease